jgi:hypothetical protein
MVADNGENGGEESNPRKRRRYSNNRKIDESVEYKTTPGRDSNGEDFIEKVKDKRLWDGLKVMVEVIKLSKWRGELSGEWFLNQSSSTTRTRLKGLALFGKWAANNQISPQTLANDDSPEVLLERCLSWIYEVEGSYTSADTCRTAVSAFYRDWFAKKDVGGNSFVCQTLRTKVGERKPSGRKKRIWDLNILLTGMRTEGERTPLQNLPWTTLVGRVGITLIIFCCCRVKDMFNIVPSKSVWKAQDGSMALAMRTKDGKGRLKFKILLHVKELGLDPIITINTYRDRCKNNSSSSDTFFVQEDGTPIASSEALSRNFLTPYIRGKNIPPPYTPYSVKTAVITTLFNEGFSKDQVSAYSGHSSNSSTALKHYHDPTNQWLGHRIAMVKSEDHQEKQEQQDVEGVSILEEDKETSRDDSSESEMDVSGVTSKGKRRFKEAN